VESKLENVPEHEKTGTQEATNRCWTLYIPPYFVLFMIGPEL